MMNPLLFMPSPRDIPDVTKWWDKLQYDKFIVKYTPQKEAYEEGKEYFLKHTQYTHIVLCPDDLEIPPHKLEILLESPYETVSGMCNLDESQPDTYDIQPLGRVVYTRDKPNTTGGMFYTKDTLPKDRYLEVGHCGSACRVISRELFDKLSFTGATGVGWWDWQISKELHKLKIPNMVDTVALFYHRRNEQKPKTDEKYSYLAY